MRLKKKMRYLMEFRFMPEPSMFVFNTETWLRLRPIKRFLQKTDPNQNHSIIDIGAGTGRLERLLK